MTKSRATALLAVFILILLAGAGLLAYQRLPSLLEQQAEAFLREYGVADVSLGRLQPGTGKFHIDTLVISGETGGVVFSASLTNLQLGYSWRRLKDRELESIELAGLDVTLRPANSATPSTTPAISVATLLPYSLLSSLPARVLRLEQWILHYQPDAGAPLAARGSLRLEDGWEVQLQAQARGLALDGVASGAESEPLAMELQIHDAGLPLVDLRARLNRNDSNSWRWSLQGDLQYGPTLAWLQRQDGYPVAVDDLPAVSGHSEFTAVIDHPDALDLKPANRSLIMPLLNISANADNTIDDLGMIDTFTRVNGRFQAELRLRQGLLDLELKDVELAGELDSAQLPLPPQLQHWLDWHEGLRMRWHSPGPVAVSSTSADRWSLQLRDAEFTVGNSVSEQHWEALSIDAALDLQEPARSSLQLTAGIKSRAQKRPLPGLQLTCSHPGESPGHEFECSLIDAAETLRLTARGSVDSDSGKGSYRASLSSPDLARTGSTLAPLLRQFALLDEKLDIESGSLALNSEFVSQGVQLDELQARSELTLQDLAGVYGEYRFSGIDLAANWTGINHWQTQQPIEFSMESLFAGIELTAVQARVALPERTPVTQPVVSIEHFSSGVFGGKVYQTEPGQWDFGAASNSISVAAEGWQLSDMVALQQTQDITALGVLDGELPVTFAAGRLMVDRGYLRARAPGGTIRYRAGEDGAALAASSPELAMAMDLLSDFQYRDLGSSVELDRAGNLLLKLNLAGSNPQQYGGHPIEFNINLEQNIDPLLRSLRLGDNLVEKLDKRLR